MSHPSNVDVDAPQLQALLDGDLASYQIEKRYVHARGHSLWVLLTVSIVRDNQGQPTYLISQLQDISERKELERRLEYLVDHDFLTALFNRRHFEQALAQETKLAARYGGRGAVLLLDLDHFKDVNDRFGHKAGDDLLKTVAAALRERIRETDILARLGGDEFGIILPQADEAQTLVVAEEVVKAMRRQTAMLAEQVIPVTASVGVVLFDHLTDIELLACADLAMYEAKESGRNRFSLYRPGKGARPRASWRLAAAEWIRHALIHDELVLYGQPILDLENNEVSQYELLVRLRSDQGKLLPPSAFLYVAERFGMIVAIDSWVVQKAVALIADQAQAGRALTLNVNISAKSVGDAQLVQVIDRALSDRRVFAWVLSILGWLAFALAAVGLYGLLAQSVAERTREFGIRMAIGSGRAHIFTLVIRQAAWIGALGTALGIGLAFLGSRLVETQLYGLTRLDPAVYVVAAASLAVVVLLAGLWPARTATRIEPVEALRVE